MPNLIENNSYNILGLHTIAKHKDIIKRSKDMVNRIMIDDIPFYNIDIFDMKSFRKENEIKDAAQNLSLPKSKIEHCFFWFQISDKIDVDAIKLLMNKDYPNALSLWCNSPSTDSKTALIHNKNAALLYTCLLFTESNMQYLHGSLEKWACVFNDKNLWESFIYVFKSHDDLDTNNDVINDFKGKALGHLSNIFTDISRKHNNKSYISEYSKLFKISGDNIEKDVLNPIFNAIDVLSKYLEEMGISKDGVYDQTEKQNVKETINKLVTEVEKLKHLGLYDDSRSKTARDRATEAIRSVVIDLHNNLQESKEAIALLEIAARICGTDSLRERTLQECETIRETIVINENNIIYDKIITLIKEGNIDNALRELQKELQRNDLPQELKNIYQNIVNDINNRINTRGKPIKSAPTLYTINGIGTKIYGDTLYFVVLYLPLLPINRYSLDETLNGYSFYGKLELKQWQKYWKYGIFIALGIWILIGFIMSILSESGNDKHISSNNVQVNQDVSSNEAADTPKLITPHLFNETADTAEESGEQTYTEDEVEPNVDIESANGKYRCSKEDSDIADSLRPDATEENYLQSEIENMKIRKDEINQLRANIDNSSVNEQSEQWQIDQYNSDIADFNRKLTLFNNDASLLKKRSEEFDKQIDKYNSYLSNNCEVQ